MKGEELGKLLLDGLLVAEDGRLVAYDGAHVVLECICSAPRPFITI